MHTPQVLTSSSILFVFFLLGCGDSDSGDDASTLTAGETGFGSGATSSSGSSSATGDATGSTGSSSSASTTDGSTSDGSSTGSTSTGSTSGSTSDTSTSDASTSSSSSSSESDSSSTSSTTTDSGGETTDDGGTSGGGSDGCGNAYPTGVNELTIDVNGTAREYLFVVPDDYDPDHAYPLIFALHGLTGDGPGLRRYFSMESFSNGSAIHVYPSGLEQRWDLSANGIDVAFFDAMVAFARENTCIDDDRIFAYGYSMGGMFSNLLGCIRGDVLRAIGPMAGSGPNGNASCVGQVASILSHGTDDPTVPFERGVASRDHWLEVNQCGTTTQPFVPEPCAIYDGCASGFPVAWCEHTGMGHSPARYFPEAAWNFFAQF